LNNRNERHKQWRKERKIKGLCRRCDDKIAAGSVDLCLFHMQSQRDYAAECKVTLAGKYTLLKCAFRRHGGDITFLQYVALISNVCFYCDGELPKCGYGLDRMNNGGYEYDNVLPCCCDGFDSCNSRKSNFFEPIALLANNTYKKTGRWITEEEFNNRIRVFKNRRDWVYKNVQDLDNDALKRLRKSKSFEDFYQLEYDVSEDSSELVHQSAI
jgi:hypothetical protein